jgi:hypothetical protein
MEFDRKRWTGTAFLFGAAVLIAGIVAELVAVWQLNNGHLVYTLDDAYIHLALAENIIAGHYGINPGQFSAPSSSILWPFLIAPVAAWRLAEYGPFAINVAAALATLFVVWRLLDLSFEFQKPAQKTLTFSALLVLFTLSSNMIGLIFTGMEHSLQLFFVCVIVLGLAIEMQTGRVASWLPAAIVLSPLVRYENLAVSLAALLYLAGRGRLKVALALLAAIVIVLASYSVFLIQLGLPHLPTSVLLKMRGVAENLEQSLAVPKGVVLITTLLGLVAFAAFGDGERRRRLLAAAASVAIAMHLVGGSYGWYHRYEVYVWAFTILILIAMFGTRMVQAISGHRSNWKLALLVILLSAGVLATSAGYVRALVTLPIASNNVYEQHYQMHRFATQYYRKPVAVLDIGYVAFRNSNYVLDLVGLASIESARHQQNPDSSWMQRLAERHDVELAMIYAQSFKELPANWTKLGELRLGRERITPFGSTVTFYALTDSAHRQALAKLPDFVDTLPDGVTFAYER